MKISTNRKSEQIAKHNKHIACTDCAMDEICRPFSIGDRIVSHILDSMERREPLAAGEYLYRKGEPLESINAITSGTLKLLRVSSSGSEQVVGFRFPGELVGDEGIAPGSHSLSAIAIDNASVCKIPMDKLDAIADKIPDFQKHLFDLLSRQCFVMHQQFSSYAARNSAEERLAAFILNIAERYTSNSKTSTEIQLAMNRDDIANFLGVRRETLSRSFSKLQKTRVISAKGKTLKILDLKALRSLALD